MKKKKKSKKFSNVPRMEKIMAMLCSMIPVGELSGVDLSWCHCYEPSMTSTEESIDSSEEEIDGANKRFVGLGYLSRGEFGLELNGRGDLVLAQEVQDPGEDHASSS